jgi:hypothetical protein
LVNVVPSYDAGEIAKQEFSMKDSVIYGIAASLVVVGIGLTYGLSPKSAGASAAMPSGSAAEVQAMPELGANMVEVSGPTDAAAAQQPQPPQRAPLPSSTPSDPQYGPNAAALARDGVSRDSSGAEVAPIYPSSDPNSDYVNRDDPVAMSDMPVNSGNGQNQGPL